MKRIALMAFVVITLFASCSKEVLEQKESPSEKILEFTASVKKSGQTSTVVITGDIFKVTFDQIYKNRDQIRTMYFLEYDKLVISSNGRQPFEFKRLAPYTYEVTYTAGIGETNRLTVWNSNSFLEKDF